MKPPPPIPATYGSLTPSAAAAATAASIALPPSRKIWIPARVASGSTVATAPPVPTATGCFDGAGAAVVPAANAAPTTPATSARAAAIRARTGPLLPPPTGGKPSALGRRPAEARQATVRCQPTGAEAGVDEQHG